MFDLAKIRSDFPMLRNGIQMQGKPLVWLDNASTTFKPDSVIEAVTKYYTEQTSNAHRGDYDLCHNMDLAIAEARKTVADFIGAESREVVFTAGTTESLNLIAYGYAAYHLQAGDEILLTEAEHASNVLPWFQIAEMTGAKVRFIPLTKEGRLTSENLAKIITKNTKIVAIAAVTNVLGYIAPVKELAEIAHKNGAILVCDGAQSVPHLKTDVRDLGCDFLVFGGHKMCGPTGIGVLYGRYDLLKETHAFLTGGGMNVRFKKDCTVDVYEPPMRFEAGTQNIEGILGLKAAVDYLRSVGMENIERHEKELKRYAVQKLQETGMAHIYNPDSESGIITFNIDGVFAQDAATFLNSKGIACRSGQHCAKLLNDFLGTVATVRASVYFYTSKEEIDALADAVSHGKEFLDAYF